jgi:hypothetical protein
VLCQGPHCKGSCPVEKNIERWLKIKFEATSWQVHVQELPCLQNTFKCASLHPHMCSLWVIAKQSVNGNAINDYIWTHENLCWFINCTNWTA